MFYIYDKKQLIYKKIRLFKPTLIVLCILSFLTASSYYTGTTHGFEKLSDVEKAIVIKKTDEFSKDKFVEMLEDLNVKFPHIVLAQSIQETGHWNSAIFLENHNLFGMKEAQRRITTAEGTNRNHAYYNHWRESVYDYAFYQCRYLSGIRSESEYFEYLSASYAEDSGYVDAIKKVIQREKLKDLFE